MASTIETKARNLVNQTGMSRLLSIMADMASDKAVADDIGLSEKWLDVTDELSRLSRVVAELQHHAK